MTEVPDEARRKVLREAIAKLLERVPDPKPAKSPQSRWVEVDGRPLDPKSVY